MHRRSYLKSVGVATGVLGTGAASANAESSGLDGDVEYDDGWTGPRIRTADDLAALSTKELQELPNELVKRPFNPEIGGGAAYDADEFEGADGFNHGGTVTAADADYTASSAAELDAALESATAGDVVWIPGDAVIDADGHSHYDLFPSRFVVPGGVTVASDRGQDGSSGGRIVKPNPDGAIFSTDGDGARFTGLHLQGGEEGFWTLDDRGVDHVYEYGLSFGIWVTNTNDDTEIDNNLVHGFSYCGIRVGRWWNPGGSEGTYIHHNDIVDIPAPNLGYGITIWDASPMIEYNYFDATRHAVAGHGGNLNSHYDFRHNLCGPRTRLHVIDMHGGVADDPDVHCELVDWLQKYVPNYVTGTMNVENNVVLATISMRPDTDYPQGGVVVRGVPTGKVVVKNNWFFHPSPPFSDVDDGNRSTVGDDGDAIVQWYTNHYCNIEASNNICEGAHPTNDIGLEAQWNPDTGRSGTGSPAASGSPPEGYGPEEGKAPDHVDELKEMKDL